MHTIKIRKNSRAYNLLKNLAIGGSLLIVGIIFPTAGAQVVYGAIRGYFKNKKLVRSIFLRDLKRLQTRKLIDYQELDNGEIKIVLTKRGKERVLRFRLDDMTLNKPRRWDGKWRLIMFDIPHVHKRARDAFRQKLRELRFYQLQKSVFITPYTCEEEIDFISSIFEVRQYLLVLSVNQFEGEEKLRHYFNL